MTTLIPQFDFKNGGSTPTGAVNRPINQKLAETVSVKDFGAVGDGTTDDTAAVQAAVNYCIANSKDLIVDGTCLLTASVNIDRAVGSALYGFYFTILTNSGGGFIIKSAIKMFSSTLTPVGVAPVSQLVMFQNIKFFANGSSAEVSGHVLDGNKFLRTEFVNCSFDHIQCIYSVNYIQSIYFINCNARFWTGNFVYTASTAYDVQVMGGIYEAGTGNCFSIIQPTGCRFYALIEGISGTALLLQDCQGVDISCYFEGNGTDFDCSDQNYVNYGVNIHGCFSAFPTSGKSFIWGSGYALVSKGNTFAGTGTLHTLTTINVLLDSNDYAQSPGVLSNTGNLVANSGFRQAAITTLDLRTTGTASWTTSDVTASYTKNGTLVNITFTATMTSTAIQGPDALYIVAGLPFTASILAPAGLISVNGGAPTACNLTNTTPPRIICSTNNIPSSIVGSAYTISANISYIATF